MAFLLLYVNRDSHNTSGVVCALHRSLYCREEKEFHFRAREGELGQGHPFFLCEAHLTVKQCGREKEFTLSIISLYWGRLR